MKHMALQADDKVVVTISTRRKQRRRVTAAILIGVVAVIAPSPFEVFPDQSGICQHIESFC